MYLALLRCRCHRRRIDVHGNAAVAQALSAYVHTHSAAARRWRQLVLSLPTWSVHIEGGHAVPAVLADLPDGLGTLVEHLQLLVAAALAVVDGKLAVTMK